MMPEISTKPLTPQEILKECKRLGNAGEQATAANLLKDALRRGLLDPPRFETAGRLLKVLLPEVEDNLRNVRILGQCTTTWLTSTLTAAGWADGSALRVTDGSYDSIVQETIELDRKTEVLVVLPWHQRLLGDGPRTAAERIQDELSTLQRVWSMAPPHVRLIQVGYDWIHAGPLGHQLGVMPGGWIHLVREMNQALRVALPPQYYFVDLEQVSAVLGHRSFYEMRNYAWTKQPFSAAGLCQLAQHISSGIRALSSGPKKVLVLDLDNTLWGGIVGETGPLGIELGDSPEGESYRRFQSFVQKLKQRGVLLAVCSKNNLADAQEPFRTNPDMRLALEDFAAFEASWDPKPVAIRRLAERLNLGLDSFVFFDDNPAEREAVRQQLPMVEVVEAPVDPAEYIDVLQSGLWFESTTITTADHERHTQYAAEAERMAVSQSAASLEDYLASLSMKAVVRDISDEEMPRVTQLIGKTNQFNLTTRRHTSEDVRALLDTPGAVGLCLRLEDRFGDYGLVSVILGVRDEATPSTLRIDTWLMSCRAIGRTVEQHLMNELVTRALQRGYHHMVGEYHGTAKNTQVASFYPDSGFTPTGRLESDESTEFALDFDSFKPLPTYVSPSP